MDGKTLAKICNVECQKRGISKKQFYTSVGVSAPSFHGWMNGAKPSEKYIKAIEAYFGIDLKNYDKPEIDDETTEVLEWIRGDFSHRALFNSAKSLTTEQSYKVAAFIERLKSGDLDDST